MKRLEVSGRARNEIERAARWWVANRPDAPTLLREELEHCFDLLELGASIGELWGERRGQEIFRVVLKRTKKKLYFSRPEPDVVRVHALWGGQRGREPKL